MDVDDLKDILEFANAIAGDGWRFRLIENPPEVNGVIVDIRYSGGFDMSHGASIRIDSDNLSDSYAPVHQTMRSLSNAARELKHRAMMDRMAKP